jgi:hypothetical protein
MNKIFHGILATTALALQAHATNLEIRNYCNFKQSAGHISVNLMANLVYPDGQRYKRYVFIECSDGRYCNGFISSGEMSGTRILDKLSIRHMATNTVLLSNNYDEFLLDIKNTTFRWTENTPLSKGGVAIHKCSKIHSE